MTSAELQIIIAELREQNELNRREHALNRREHLLNRREHQLNRQLHAHVIGELERQGELNRRAYDEGLALCARLVAQSTAAMQEFARSMEAFRRRMAMAEVKIDTSVEETRAQTQALLKVIDRMDRLDGGGAAAS